MSCDPLLAKHGSRDGTCQQKRKALFVFDSIGAEGDTPSCQTRPRACDGSPPMCKTEPIPLPTRRIYCRGSHSSNSWLRQGNFIHLRTLGSGVPGVGVVHADQGHARCNRSQSEASNSIHSAFLDRSVGRCSPRSRLQAVPLIIWRRTSMLQSYVRSILSLKEKR